MRRILSLLCAASLCIAGCGPTAPVGSKPAPTSTTTAASGAASTPSPDPAKTPSAESPIPPETSPSTAAEPVKAADADPVKPAAADETSNASAEATTAAAGPATLAPENTKIEFVGTHVGPKPDPRVGSFAKFAGKMELDAAAKTVKSISIEIDTTSLTTQFPKLTDHLKSADFLEVREFPTIKFESTKIEVAGGTHQITGKLTLHGVTKDITIPAQVDVVDGAPTLKSEFSIDRTEYGIAFGPDKVEKKVSLTVAVGGKKT